MQNPMTFAPLSQGGAPISPFSGAPVAGNNAAGMSALGNPQGILDMIKGFLYAGGSGGEQPPAQSGAPSTPSAGAASAQATTGANATKPKMFDIKTPEGGAQLGNLLATVGGMLAQNDQQKNAASTAADMSNRVIYGNQMQNLLNQMQGPQQNP